MKNLAGLKRNMERSGAMFHESFYNMSCRFSGAVNISKVKGGLPVAHWGHLDCKHFTTQTHTVALSALISLSLSHSLSLSFTHSLLTTLIQRPLWRTEHAQLALLFAPPRPNTQDTPLRIKNVAILVCQMRTSISRPFLS